MRWRARAMLRRLTRGAREVGVRRRSPTWGQASYSDSRAMIFSTRATWRPPSNSAVRNASTQPDAPAASPRCAPPSRARWRRCAVAESAAVTGSVALTAADAVDLVGHDLLAGAAAAEDDPEAAVARRDRARCRRDVVGVVDRVLTWSTEVDHLVAMLIEPVHHQLLERQAGVVGTDRDAHHASACGAVGLARAIGLGDDPATISSTSSHTRTSSRSALRRCPADHRSTQPVHQA